ncbi:hypothetical protein ABIF65_010180 [Bradyrhizobium japonicum]
MGAKWISILTATGWAGRHWAKCRLLKSTFAGWLGNVSCPRAFSRCLTATPQSSPPRKPSRSAAGNTLRPQRLPPFQIGVDNQVTWPKEEALITFEQYRLVLMPKTKDHLRSVHIDLTANCLDERGALTVVSPSQLHRLDAGGNLDYRLVALGGSAYITLERRR